MLFRSVPGQMLPPPSSASLAFILFSVLSQTMAHTSSVKHKSGYIIPQNPITENSIIPVSHIFFIRLPCLSTKESLPLSERFIHYFSLLSSRICRITDFSWLSICILAASAAACLSFLKILSYIILCSSISRSC